MGADANEPERGPPRVSPRTEYRRILVPVTGPESGQAMVIACQLASEHGGAVIVVAVIEVEPELPLDAHMVEEEAEAKRLVSEAGAVADRYGVSIVPRTVRARAAGEAIIEEVKRTNAEIIVLRAPRKRRVGRRASMFGKTVDYVLKHAPCRVMLAAAPQAQ